MDIQSIMRSITEQQGASYQTMYNQQAMLDSGKIDMNKHEMKKNGSFYWLIPMQLQFEFNPLDPTDPTFSTKHPYRVEGSAEDFVKSLKEYLNKPENVELKAKYAKLGGMTVDEYDTSDPSTITEQDIAIFAQKRKAAVLSKYTQKIRTASAGKYGTERVTPIKLDAEGKIAVESEGLVLTQLLEFERAIRREKIAKFKLENPGNNLTQDQKDALKAIKNSTALSYPHLSGVIFVYELPCDSKKEQLDKLPSEDLADYLTYLNCGNETLKKIQKKVGKKADVYLDYLPVLVTYGDGTGDKTLELNLYGSREYEVKAIDNKDYNLIENIDDFEEKIHDAIAAGLEGEYNKAASSGIFKFNNYSDQEVLGYFPERMEELKSFICKEIFMDFGAIIEKTNISLFKELSELDKQNKLPISKCKVINAQLSGTVDEAEVQASLAALDAEEENEAANQALGSEEEELNGGSDLASLAK